MSDDRLARRRALGAARQARYRQAHAGQFQTLQIPARLHAALKSRAHAAGLPVHRYLTLKIGAC